MLSASDCSRGGGRQLFLADGGVFISQCAYQALKILWYEANRKETSHAGEAEAIKYVKLAFQVDWLQNQK